MLAVWHGGDSEIRKLVFITPKHKVLVGDSAHTSQRGCAARAGPKWRTWHAWQNMSTSALAMLSFSLMMSMGLQRQRALGHTA